MIEIKKFSTLTPNSNIGSIVFSNFLYERNKGGTAYQGWHSLFLKNMDKCGFIVKNRIYCAFSQNLVTKNVRFLHDALFGYGLMSQKNHNLGSIKG